MKRTPLRRTGALKRRTPLRARTTLRRLTPLKPVSAKRRKERRAADPVVAVVFERDGGCVLRTRTDVAGPCFGQLTPHHLRKQGQGGKWLPGNLVVLCSHHNCTWVETHREQAWGLGLVVNRGETLREAWSAMRTAGLAVGEGTP